MTPGEAVAPSVRALPFELAVMALVGLLESPPTRRRRVAINHARQKVHRRVLALPRARRRTGAARCLALSRSFARQRSLARTRSLARSRSLGLGFRLHLGHGFHLSLAFLVLCNMKPSDSEDGSHECCPI